MSAAPTLTPTVSIVVPTRNAERTLEALLTSLLQQDPPALEILVVDNSSSDATPSLATRDGVRYLEVGGERSRQRNAGLRAARGSVVVFLDADMIAPPDLVGACIAAVRQGYDAVVLPMDSFGDGFWARCRVLERRCYEGEPLVEAARAFDRDLLDRLGGFDEALHAFEDWELHDRCAASGARVGHARFTAKPLLHDEGRLNIVERARKGRYYGQALARYRTRPGAARRLSPLARLWLFARHGDMLLRAPHLAVGLMVLKSAEVIGGLAPHGTDPYAPAARPQVKAGDSC